MGKIERPCRTNKAGSTIQCIEIYYIGRRNLTYYKQSTDFLSATPRGGLKWAFPAAGSFATPGILQESRLEMNPTARLLTGERSGKREMERKREEEGRQKGWKWGGMRISGGVKEKGKHLGGLAGKTDSRSRHVFCQYGKWKARCLRAKEGATAILNTSILTSLFFLSFYIFPVFIHHHHLIQIYRCEELLFYFNLIYFNFFFYWAPMLGLPLLPLHPPKKKTSGPNFPFRIR